MVQRRELTSGHIVYRSPNNNGGRGFTYYIETPRDNLDCGYPDVLVWDSNAISPDILSACLAWELDKTPTTPPTLTKEFKCKM